VQLQPRNNPLNEDAALLKRYSVGGGPDAFRLTALVCLRQRIRNVTTLLPHGPEQHSAFECAHLDLWH
jgi:hypothetical protein